MHGCVQEYVCSSSIGFVFEANSNHITSFSTTTTTGSVSDDVIQSATREYEPRHAACWQEWNARTTPGQRRACRDKVLFSKEISAVSNNKTNIYNSDSSDKEKENCSAAMMMCSDCHLPLRPKVVMFGDTCPNVLSR
jgi:hypothetical protein